MRWACNGTYIFEGNVHCAAEGGDAESEWRCALKCRSGDSVNGL